MNFLALFLVPFIGGCSLFFFGKNYKAAQIWNFVLHAVWIAFLVIAWGQIPNTAEAGAFPTVFSLPLFKAFKSNFELGADGVNMPLVALNIFLSLCLAFYYWARPHLGSKYLGLFSLLNSASVGSLLASDALTFYIFWEFMLIPLFFLILKWGSKNRIYAALKFFAFTMAGSLLLLLALIALAVHPAVTSLSWHDLHAVLPGFVDSQLATFVFFGFIAAFIVKIPVWPLHTWLPDAHTEAPTGASVLLAGVLLKLGVYGIARWCLPLFPMVVDQYATLFMILGVIGIVLGSFSAWQQSDIKRTIAYSSVAHLGFMVLGLFSQNVEGLQGALFQNIAHGLSTGALFLIFGIIYDQTHTREILDYGGMASQNKFLATTFVFASMASVALPGLPGFVGEFLILTGTFYKNSYVAVVAMSGVLLGAIYTLTLVRKMVFGPKTATMSHLAPQATWSEWLAIVPLIVAMVVLGIRPQFVFEFSRASVEALLATAVK